MGWNLLILREFDWLYENSLKYLHESEFYRLKLGYSEKFLSPNHPQIRELTSGNCGVCFEDGMLVSNICGEKYCVKCWQNYIGQSLDCQNPFMKCISCDAPLLHELIEFILEQNLALAQRYQKIICSLFCKVQTDYQCCPETECAYVIKCER